LKKENVNAFRCSVLETPLGLMATMLYPNEIVWVLSDEDYITEVF
jgi:hypothetical protein